MGTGLLVLVWVMQSVFFVHRMAKLDYMPVITLFDTLFLISWFMVTFSLVMYFFVRFDLLVFYVNILAFSFLVISFFNPSTVAIAETGWDLKDELLYIHIFMAITSYAVLLIGAIFSCMYLFLHHKLKIKQLSVTMRRLPSLDKIEVYIFRTVIIGGPLLAIAIVLGMIRIAWIGEYRMIFDPKVFNSFLILMAYGFYLVQRLNRHCSGNKLALWNLAAFMMVVINFIISNTISEFHPWIRS